MNSRWLYRFFINSLRVYPVKNNGNSLTFNREGDFIFPREKVTGNFTFLRGDWDAIWNNTLDTEFTLLCQKIDDDGAYQDYFTAKFFKTKGKFSEDRKTIEIELETVDKYKLLLAAFDRQIEVVKTLSPPVYKVNYTKEPLIQIVFPYHNMMFNKIGHADYITNLSTIYTIDELEDFGFARDGEFKIYIPGSADLTPDVSGVYEKVSDTQFNRLDGVYRIVSFTTPLHFWEITEVGNSTILYRAGSPLSSGDLYNDIEPFSINSPFSNPLVFDPYGSSVSPCAAFPLNAYQRVLTDATEIAGTPTLPIPENDIDGLKFNYLNLIDSASDYMIINARDEHSTTALEIGRFSENALHFSGEYFNFIPYQLAISFIGAIGYELFTQSWTQYFIGVHLNPSHLDDLEEAKSTVTLNHAYKLGDVIKLMLSNIDSSINFNSTSFYSKFLFSGTNPLTGEAQSFTHFITPKSNILTGTYTNEAVKAPLKFTELDELLNRLNCKWYIDENNNFIIEHIQYFKNGKSYLTEVIGVDLTNLTDPRVGKKWSHHTREYGYRELQMPEFLSFPWMDVTSKIFDGTNIQNLSNFVNKGVTEEKRVSNFTSDITFGSAIQDNVSKDGFYIFNAYMTSGVWNVPFITITTPNGGVAVQNGFWSNWNINEKFWKHNLSAPEAIINGETIDALSTKRLKDQTVTIPNVQPDFLRLIETSVGVGEIDKMEINLTTRALKVTVLHDLDFDAPG